MTCGGHRRDRRRAPACAELGSVGRRDRRHGLRRRRLHGQPAGSTRSSRGGPAHRRASSRTCPSPLRYAAVAAAADTARDRRRLARGRHGERADPRLHARHATGVRTIGHLPSPTTHAAAAALGGRRLRHRRPRRGDRHTDGADRRDRPGHAAHRAPRGRSAPPRSDLAAVVRRQARSCSPADAGTAAPKRHDRRARGREDGAARDRRGVHRAEHHATPARDVYAYDGANKLTGAARFAKPLIYVPNSQSDTVDVIDPQHLPDRRALRRRRPAPARRPGLGPAHALRHERPRQQPDADRPAHRQAAGAPIPVDDPYNMYFTPDGRYAIVVAERLHRLDFRNAHTLQAAPLAHGALHRRRPHGLHRRRPLPARELRVLGPDRRGRRRSASGSSRTIDAARRRRRHAAGRQALARRRASSTSPTCTRTASGRSTRTRSACVALPADRRRRARPLPEPRREAPLRHEPRRRLDLA